MTADPSHDRLDPFSRIIILVAVGLGLYLYLGRLSGTPIQRGNEAMYAAPPARMIETGDYMLPLYRGEPFLDKPILTFWVVAASYRLFGVSVFAERLPIALVGLATALLAGLWVRRRAGERAGALAGLILLFSFAYVFIGMTFAADTFLTLAVFLAALALYRACLREDGSDAALGALAGAALALAFYFKGLVGIVLPTGAVATALLLDRRWPIRAWRRGAWALACLLALLLPWHLAMHHRLGTVFWNVFYWENQFLRASTHLQMRPTRGPLYYLGILAWGLFPFSLVLPAGLRPRRPWNLAVGWLGFGLVFWSLLVMKREVYVVPILPAAAVLAARGLSEPGRFAAAWRRASWILAAALVLVLLAFWARLFRAFADYAGMDAAVLVGVALGVLAAALAASALDPQDSRRPLVVALAVGVVCLALRVSDERLGRYDPLPDWGERVRRECGSDGCDGFLLGDRVTSLEFYSGFDWTWFPYPSPQIAERLRHPKGFLIMPTKREPELAGLPLDWEVLDRRRTFGSYSMDKLLGPPEEAMVSLSLVRLRRPEPSGADR